MKLRKVDILDTMKKGRKNYTLKVIKNRVTIQIVRTHSIRRFINNLRTINWKNGGVKVYLRVNYRKKVDVFGKLSTFYNDGWYKAKEDLWSAFNAFKEED